MDDKLLHKILQFKQICKDLVEVSSVPYLATPPTSFEFHRDFVTQNKPVIIKNAINHWPALSRWDQEYISSAMGDQRVVVSITPNGYADAIFGELFATPFEMEMLFSEFLAVLNDQRPNHLPNGVYYIQQQNSNFTSNQFSSLRKDTEGDIPWATKAFGAKPEAVNFWMGDKQAITSRNFIIVVPASVILLIFIITIIICLCSISKINYTDLHKDHYENIYCVIRGRKKFILHPPTDRPFIPHGMYRQGQYDIDKVTKEFYIKEECDGNNSIPWVSVDPLKPDFGRYPLYQHAHRLEVTVEAGETLYLPSLWFHHVQQEHGTIAINYWYDMEFGLNYCYYQLLSELAQ